MVAQRAEFFAGDFFAEAPSRRDDVVRSAGKNVSRCLSVHALKIEYDSQIAC